MIDSPVQFAENVGAARKGSADVDAPAPTTTEDPVIALPASQNTTPLDPLAPGAFFTVAYPFKREEYERWDGDENPPYKVPTWTPGIYSEIVGPEGDTDTFADAVGFARFTVVSTHKPGKYPERVFYVRTWIDPDGKQFGKSKLRITTRPVFLRLTRGYGFEYQIKGCADCKAMFWASRDHRGHAIAKAEGRS